MTCNNNEITNFRGDDLVDIINVNRPTGADDLTIIKAEVQVGNLPPFVKENPVFPYTISIWRDQSARLSADNPIYLRIYYMNTDYNVEVRQTCLGSLNLKTVPQVVKDVTNG